MNLLCLLVGLEVKLPLILWEHFCISIFDIIGLNYGFDLGTRSGIATGDGATLDFYNLSPTSSKARFNEEFYCFIWTGLTSTSALLGWATLVQTSSPGPTSAKKVIIIASVTSL